VTGSRIAQAPPHGTPRLQDAGGEPSAGSFLKRPEVRDALAWMRLLIDPTDASAVVRALARPPVELRQVDLARVIQVARRRKLDLVLGLTAASESSASSICTAAPPPRSTRSSRISSSVA
jgi:superfamily I DNA/RNA helicase